MKEWHWNVAQSVFFIVLAAAMPHRAGALDSFADFMFGVLSMLCFAVAMSQRARGI